MKIKSPGGIKNPKFFLVEVVRINSYAYQIHFSHQLSDKMNAYFKNDEYTVSKHKPAVLYIRPFLMSAITGFFIALIVYFVTKSNYIDVVVPTLKEITPNLNQDQQGFNVTVEKVQYAAEQTRVYVTIRNNSADKMSFSNYDTRILMNGQQIEQKDDWDAELPKLSYEILPGASTSGVLTFPAIDQNQAFQLIIPSIYSDNWELDYEFKDMVFDIQP